ncbi:hypothetical protein G7067_04355 [Leucobacter insecticola]|uniref:Big-1 domain-containing protein n=1 Tax=Leucobacter insecticola TaxID=2714934 RepID=A0A6G8FHI2_9MICO|nr:hypothetical protein G7067_04355 [Leucobacter insecticola]
MTATSSDGIDSNACQVTGTCGEPLSVTVLATGTAAKSQIAAAPATVTADGESASTITVTAFDAAGERINIGGAKVELVSDFGTVSEVVDNKDGTYTATITSTVAGTATIGFTLNNVAATPKATVAFVAGAVDPENADTKYSVSENEITVGEGSHTVTVKLVDRYGNPVLGQAAGLRASTEDDLGGGDITDFVPTSTPGEYTAAVTSTLAGSKAITVTRGGEPGEAVALSGNGVARFVAGAPSAASTGTKYAVSTGDASVAGGSHTITLTVADAFGNPVSGQAAKLGAATTDALGTGEVSVFTESATPGTYTATVTSTVAGEKAITATFDGGAVRLAGNGAAKFVSSGVSLANPGTSYAVSGGEVSVAGGSHTVTVKLADEFGNPVSGKSAELEAATENALGTGRVTGFAETGTAGTYTATVTSSVSGGKVVTVTFGGDEVTLDGNDTAEFISGGVSVDNAGTSYAVSTGNQEVGSGSHVVTVKLTDADNNPVVGQSAGLKATTVDALGDGGITDFVESGTPGTYTATVTSTVSGTKAIQVAFGGDAVTLDGNRNAVFVAAGVDVSGTGTSYAVSTGDQVAGSGSHTVTVKLVDEFGNAVPGVEAKLAAATEDALGTGEVGDFTETETAGTYTAEVTSTVVGDKAITVTFDGALVTLDGNDTAVFVAAAVSTANAGTSYVVSPGDQVAGSGSHTVTVKLADEFGNPVPGQASKLEASTEDALGAGGVTDVVESGTPGTYTATVTSTVSGDKVMTVLFDGAAVRLDGNGTAVFIAAGVNVSHAGTQYAVSTGEEVAGSGSHTVTVKLVDEFGNAVPGQATSLMADTEDDLGDGVIASFVESATPGTYTAAVSSTVTGVKALTVTANGASVRLEGNGEAVFVAAAVDVSQPGTQYAVSTGTRVVGSGSHSVTVKLVDGFGNPVPGQASKLAAATTDELGTGEFTVFSESAVPGTYTAAVTSTVAGEKTITVQYNSKTVTLQGNGIAEFVAADVNLAAEGTNYEVSTGEVSVAGGSHTVTAKLVDEFGNPVSGQAAKLGAATTDALGTGEVSVFTESATPGTYTATVTSTVAGEKAITATFDGGAVRLAGNGAAKFVSSGVSLANPGTSYAVSGGEVSVAGGSHTVTVKLADEFGNPVSGKSAELEAATENALGTGRVTGFAETGTAGTYTATVTSSVSGGKVVTVTFGGDEVTLDGNDTAEFISGGVSVDNAGTSYAVSTGNQEVGSGSHVVTVKLTDADNNPVVGQSAGLKATTVDALGDGGITDFVESGTPGTYTATVTSTVSGTKAIQVAFGGDAVTLDGNRNAVFVAAGVDVSGTGTSYAVSTGDQVAGSGSHTVTVKLVDEFGNAVPGVEAKLAAATEDALGTGEVGDFTETETAGTYTAEVTSTVVGDKAITVTFDGALVTLDGNDTAVFVAAAVSTANAGTSYVVSPGDQVAGSGSHTVTVKLADEFGNPVPGQASKLEASTEDALGAGGVTDVVESGTPGTYTATVTSTVSGDKVMTVLFDGAAVRLDGNGTAVFIAAGVNVSHAGTQYAVSTGEEVAGSGSHTVTVKLVDEFGNAVPGQATSLMADTEDDLGDGVIASFVESATPGTYTAAVSSTVTGVKALTVTANGASVRLEGNGEAVFVAAAVDVSQPGTQYAVSTGTRVVGSGSHSVTVKLVDGFGNPVPGQASKLAAATTDELGTGEFTVFSESAVPGTYTAAVTSTVAGEKTITVQYNSKTVTLQGNGIAEFVAADVDVKNPGTAYTVSTGEEVAGSGSHTVTVKLADAFGNPVPGQAAKLAAAAADSLGDGVISSFEETDPGSYAATITSSRSGAKPISVSYFGEALKANGNADAVFVEGAFDSANTTITVTPASLPTARIRASSPCHCLMRSETPSPLRCRSRLAAPSARSRVSPIWVTVSTRRSCARRRPALR